MISKISIALVPRLPYSHAFQTHFRKIRFKKWAIGMFHPELPSRDGRRARWFSRRRQRYGRARYPPAPRLAELGTRRDCEGEVHFSNLSPDGTCRWFFLKQILQKTCLEFRLEIYCCGFFVDLSELVFVPRNQYYPNPSKQFM